MLCRQLSQLPSVDSFYVPPHQEGQRRFDDSRLTLIVLTKLLEYVQAKKSEFRKRSNMADFNKWSDLAETMILSILSYF